MFVSRLSVTLVSFTTLLVLIGCRGVNSNNEGGGIGELTLGITDGPTDFAQEVRLVLDGIEITPTGGAPILIDVLREDNIDLLDLQGGEREELIRNYDLPDGSYESVRLIVDDVSSRIRLDNNNEFELTIPAGEESNLVLDLDIILDEDNDEEDFTIDVDLRRSIWVDETVNPPVYTFHPRMRIVETSRTTTLTGSVDEALIEDNSCENGGADDEGNAVYVFRGSSVDIQDIQDNADDPYATATVDYNNISDQWEFAVGFLPVGNYTAVFTCNAVLDNPQTDDESELDFSIAQTIDVQLSGTDSLRFE